MINTEGPNHDPGKQDAEVEDIVASGPHGAIAVAGIATFVVVALWVLFFWVIFLPRGATP